MINIQLWGQSEGKDVWLYTLSNSQGMVVEITNYGGIVSRIVAPDRNGKLENIVLGFDNFAQYEKHNSPYLGAIIGRYANRISNAGFVLEGIQHFLEPNENPNHLHGGTKGFDKAVWSASEISDTESVGVVLQYLSKDSEEGYPGNLNIKVAYVLNNNNELQIFYEAKTDKPTILNLTNHSYFNLTAGNENILNHELTVFADYYTPTDKSWIPTGEIARVSGTDLDFTQPQRICKRINNLNSGYNANYILRKKSKNELSKAAEVFDSESGRMLQVYTTEPGLQLYTGDYLDDSAIGNGNIAINKNMGLCLEAQHFPDSPNNPAFPSTELKPGEVYSQLTVYKFLTL